MAASYLPPPLAAVGGAMVTSSTSADSVEGELFRLRSELRSAQQREAELQQLLSEKNEVEDRLRNTVNELQLSLELARMTTAPPADQPPPSRQSPFMRPANATATPPPFYPLAAPATPNSSMKGAPSASSGTNTTAHCSTCRCGKSPLLKVRRTPPPTSLHHHVDPYVSPDKLHNGGHTTSPTLGGVNGSFSLGGDERVEDELLQAGMKRLRLEE